MLKIDKINPKSKIELNTLTNIINDYYFEIYSKILKKEIIEYILSFIEIDYLKNKIILDEHEFYFLKEDRKITGFFEIYKKENILKIEKLYVIKEKRNKGFGKYILDYIFKNNKKEKFEININKNLIETQNYFTYQNFKYKNKIAKYIGEDHFLYEKIYTK